MCSRRTTGLAQRSAAIGYSSGEEKGQSLGRLLEELKAAHAELLGSTADMERATASAAPNLMDYAKARFHISRASLHRRTISREARLRLASCVSGTDEAIIAKLTVMNDGLAREGAAHIGKWTVDAIQRDWR